MLYLSNPLKRMRVTQPFGVNYVTDPATGKIDDDYYRNVGIPSGLHNGVDLSAVIGTPIYAEADGWLKTGELSDGNKFATLEIPDEDERKLSVRHLHCSEVAPDGMRVSRGEQIALTGNTGGTSTGPHLHFDCRWIDALGRIENYSNGYHGMIDPAKVFPKDWLDLPVDKRYGNEGKPEVPSDLVFYKTNYWFWKSQGRLMTTRERNAFQYGFWDLRTVLDPAWPDVWMYYDKPTAKSKNLI